MSVPEPSDISVAATPLPDNVIPLPVPSPMPELRDEGALVPMTEAAITLLTERIFREGFLAGQRSLTGLRSV